MNDPLFLRWQISLKISSLYESYVDSHGNLVLINQTSFNFSNPKSERHLLVFFNKLSSSQKFATAHYDLVVTVALN